MSNPTATPRETTPRHWALPVAIGLAATLAGSATTAWYRHRAHTADFGHVEASEPTHEDRPEPNSQPTLAGANRAVLDLKHAVTQRPGLALATTAIVAAVLTAAAIILPTITPPGAGESVAAPRAHIVDMPPPAKDADPIPMIYRDAPIPMMSDGRETAGSCTADGVCTGKVLTIEFGGDRPWMVTRVAYRPLEFLPGRRVTRLRWELHDVDQRSGRDTVVFSQTDDSPAAFTSDGLAGQSHGATRITAVVEASVPAPGAVRTYYAPFEAYGYPVRNSGEADFPTRSTVDTVTWPTPLALSRITIIPGDETGTHNR